MPVFELIASATFEADDLDAAFSALALRFQQLAAGVQPGELAVPLKEGSILMGMADDHKDESYSRARYYVSLASNCTAQKIMESVEKHDPREVSTR